MKYSDMRQTIADKKREPLDVGPPPDPLNYGGFRLWRIDHKDASAHPDGAMYAGVVRLPDGRYFGINATLVERAGKRYFEGGAYSCEPVADLWPAEGCGTRVRNTGRANDIDDIESHADNGDIQHVET